MVESTHSLSPCSQPEIIMPKYVCSYAHDISCYADFVVTAKNEKTALRLIKKALREGRFQNVDAAPCWENGSINERVFVQGPATEYSPDITLAELTGQKHRISPATGRCINCGQSPKPSTQTPCLTSPPSKPKSKTRKRSGPHPANSG
jgi:hypothetical protein